MPFRRRSAKPSDDPPPDGLGMTITDIFWVTPPPTSVKLVPVGRRAFAEIAGTAVMGELLGDGVLRAGDTVIAENGRFEIVNFVQAMRTTERVEPPCNVAIRLGVDVAKDLFTEGEKLRFERNS